MTSDPTTAEQEEQFARAAAELHTVSSTSHIFFKDLKLLAHDEDSEEEEEEGDVAMAHGVEAGAAAGGGAGTSSGSGGHAHAPGVSAAEVDGSAAPAAILPPLAGVDGLGFGGGGASASLPITARRGRKRVDRQRLIVILVGLPARGKTFLCNKLMCYLNWCGGGGW